MFDLLAKHIHRKQSVNKQRSKQTYRKLWNATEGSKTFLIDLELRKVLYKLPVSSVENLSILFPNKLCELKILSIRLRTQRLELFDKVSCYQ